MREAIKIPDENNNGTSAIEPIYRSKIDKDFSDLVNSDFVEITTGKGAIKLATTDEIANLHRIHTIEGHAQNGHSMFYQMVGSGSKQKKQPVIYENATLKEIVHALNMDLGDFKRHRQIYINDIQAWMMERIATLRNPSRETDYSDIKLVVKNNTKWRQSKSEPLAGAKLFKHHILKNFDNVLLGFYVGTCVDSYEWRKKTEEYIEQEYGSRLRRIYGEQYNFTMHKGSCRAVNVDSLKRNGLKIRDLPSGNYANILKIDEHASLDEMLGMLEHNDIISPDYKVKNADNFTPNYVSLTRGWGISDDAVFITLSLLFGVEAGFGFLLADAIDTLDKYAEHIYKEGQDDAIGKEVKQNYELNLKKLMPVSDEDIMKIIYVSAIDQYNSHFFPSCSQRRFWEIDEHESTAVDSHFAFINHLKNHVSRPPPPRNIGFKGINNMKFYYAYVDKLVAMMNIDMVKDDYGISTRKVYSQENGDSGARKLIRLG